MSLNVEWEQHDYAQNKVSMGTGNSSRGKGRKEAKKEQHVKEAGVWELLQFLSFFNTFSNQAIWPAVSAGCLYTPN